MRILTDAQLEQDKKTVFEMKWRLYDERKRLETVGHTGEEIDRILDPQEGMILEIMDEICAYNALRAGVVPPFTIDRLSVALVWCRIASGMTQAEFSQKRGVSVEQVDRDERNEYRGTDMPTMLLLLGELGFALAIVRNYQAVKTV